MNHYEFDGPLCVSFSGGRTSGYMLRKILDAGLPEESAVVFTNTGKERPETLDFIHEVETKWGVPIVWVEWRDGKLREGDPGFEVVTYETASRDGEPFAALIEKKRFLPNPVTRYCTQELKIEASKRYLKKALGWAEWTSAIGIRADEPRRWKVRGVHPRAPHEERAIPLADAGVTEPDVMAFWAAQPFDLQLRQWEGNCDLCFLKGTDKRRRIMRDSPELSGWWDKQEQRGYGRDGSACTFREGTATYAQLQRQVDRQPMLPGLEDPEDENLMPCMCTD